MKVPKSVRRFWIAGAVLFLGGATCHDGRQEVAVVDECAAPRHTILFVDHSASTAHRSIPPEISDSLHRLPERYLRCPGDQLQAFVVHKRTRGRAVRLDLVNDLPPAAKEARSKSERAAELLEQQQRQAAFAERSAQQVSEFLERPEGGEVAVDSTDLLGTLDVASEQFGSAPPEAAKLLVYFSDMFESMSGPGRRDFDRAPPSSIEEAETWAAEDVEAVLPTFRLNPEAFEGARVRVLSRPWGSRSGTEFVRWYWYAIFEAVGIPRKNVGFY